MDQNNLGSFRSDIAQGQKEQGTAGQAAMYHQELNTLRIEKLSHRITIISVILPCIIIAILVFAYIDMKERVLDADEAQVSQVQKIARALEEKLNALDVRIAKTTFDLDEKLTLIETKSREIEARAAKIYSSKADLKSVETALAKKADLKSLETALAEKADLKSVRTQLTKIEKRVQSNSAQHKSTLATVERVNSSIQADIKAIRDINAALQADMKKSNTQFQAASQSIKKEIALFKEEFDARLLELSVYEQELAALTKATGLLDKKVRTLKQDSEAYTDSQLAALKSALKTEIKNLDLQNSSTVIKPVVVPGIAPILNQEVLTPPATPPVSNQPGGISEQNLTQ